MQGGGSCANGGGAQASSNPAAGVVECRPLSGGVLGTRLRPQHQTQHPPVHSDSEPAGHRPPGGSPARPSSPLAKRVSKTQPQLYRAWSASLSNTRDTNSSSGVAVYQHVTLSTAAPVVAGVGPAIATLPHTLSASQVTSAPLPRLTSASTTRTHPSQVLYAASRLASSSLSHEPGFPPPCPPSRQQSSASQAAGYATPCAPSRRSSASQAAEYATPCAPSRQSSTSQASGFATPCGGDSASRQSSASQAPEFMSCSSCRRDSNDQLILAPLSPSQPGAREHVCDLVSSGQVSLRNEVVSSGQVILGSEQEASSSQVIIGSGRSDLSARAPRDGAGAVAAVAGDYDRTVLPASKTEAGAGAGAGAGRWDGDRGNGGRSSSGSSSPSYLHQPPTCVKSPSTRALQQSCSLQGEEGGRGGGGLCVLDEEGPRPLSPIISSDGAVLHTTSLQRRTRGAAVSVSDSGVPPQASSPRSEKEGRVHWSSSGAGPGQDSEQRRQRQPQQRNTPDSCFALMSGSSLQPQGGDGAAGGAGGEAGPGAEVVTGVVATIIVGDCETRHPVKLPLRLLELPLRAALLRRGKVSCRAQPMHQAGVLPNPQTKPHPQVPQT